MLNKNILYYRKRNGMTQEELSKKNNISRSAIALYEKGIRIPNAETIKLFCELFKITYEELMYFDFELKNNQIPERFRMLKQKDVIKVRFLAHNHTYIINEIYEEYMNVIRINSNYDIYLSNIPYEEIECFEILDKYSKATASLL